MPSTTYINYEFEIEEFCDGRFFATVSIEVECDPGEPMVRYTRNGDGYPGSPPSVCPVEAEITSLSGATWDKSRDELRAFLGDELLKKLDEQALEWACDNVDGGGWLQDHLFDELAARSEPPEDW